MALSLAYLKPNLKRKSKEKLVLLLLLFLLLVYDEANSVFVEYDSVIDEQSKLWRFYNIIMPLISLSPLCKGSYVLPCRDQIFDFVKNHDVFPPLYDGVNLRSAGSTDFVFKQLDRLRLFDGVKLYPRP